MKISKRERDVLCLMCLSNKQIAERLNISIVTVKTYIVNLLNKFVTNNRSQVIICALKQNVIDLQDIVIED